VEHAKKVLEDKDKEITTMKRRIKAPKAYPVQTAELITTSQEKEQLLDHLSQLTLRAQQDRKKIQILEAHVKSLHHETPVVQSIEEQ